MLQLIKIWRLKAPIVFKSFSVILYLVVMVILFLVAMVILSFFSEPFYCSSPNVFERMNSINSAQGENWNILSDSLRVARDAELARRRAIGAISTAVTLTDIGVTWSPRNRVFAEYPGLASLYAIRPQWFERKGETRVTALLDHMASDPSL